MANVIWLKDMTEGDRKQVGEKAYNLSRLCSNFNVPLAYVVTAKAFENFLLQNAISANIRRLIASAQDDPGSLQNIANRIQELIVKGTISEELKNDLMENYQLLEVAHDKTLNEMILSSSEALVSLRCSPSYESRKKHFSVLGVKGEAGIVRELKNVWASLYTAKAIEDRLKREISFVGMAVIVQKMVDSDVSGKIETGKKISVQACYGLGNIFNSEKAMPDIYVVDRDSHGVLETEYKEQTVKSRILDGRLVLDKVSGAEGAKLSDDDLTSLSKAALKIEKAIGTPVEIDFAMKDEEFYFLSVQSITQETQKPLVGNLEDKENDEFNIRIEKKEDVDESVRLTDDDLMPKKAEEPKPEPEKEQKSFFSIFQWKKDKTDHADASTKARKPVDLVVDEPKKEIDVSVEKKRLSVDAKDKGSSSDDLLEKARYTAGDLVVCCDMAISRALKRRYKEVFGSEPVEYLDKMVEKLGEKTNVPYDEEIRKIRALRNRFVEKYVPPTGTEVSFAMQVTENFFKQF